jgi:hypothetical protein
MLKRRIVGIRRASSKVKPQKKNEDIPGGSKPRKASPTNQQTSNNQEEEESEIANDNAPSRLNSLDNTIHF